MKLKLMLKQFIHDEEGQSTTEYILILAVVVMIAMRFRQKIASKIESAADQVGTNIEKTIGDMAQ
jgi:Flp pilus assembly pilin Flp